MKMRLLRSIALCSALALIAGPATVANAAMTVQLQINPVNPHVRILTRAVCARGFTAVPSRVNNRTIYQCVSNRPVCGKGWLVGGERISHNRLYYYCTPPSQIPR